MLDEWDQLFLQSTECGTMLVVKRRLWLVSPIYLLARSKVGSHETPLWSKTHHPITLDFLRKHTQESGPVTIALQALSKFASHYAWGTNAVSECKIYVKFTWISIWYQMDHVSFSKPPLGGRPNTKLETMALWNFIIFYQVWGPHMNRNSLKEHLVEGPVTYDFTLHLRAYYHTTWFWKCLGMEFKHFFWALTISWSWLLGRVWSGPKPWYRMPTSKLDDF